VLAAPYLPEVYLAKALITLDHLSGGRIDVGLGAGWREEEFTALGQDFGSGASRRERLERTLDAIGALAAGEGAAIPGSPPGRPPGAEEPHSRGVRSGPPSVQQPRPPLWIAGKGPKILEVVGRRADWANFARGISVEDFHAAGEVVAAAARDAGRADGGPKLSLTGTFLGAGDPDEVARVVERRAGERGKHVDAYRAQLRRSNAFVGTPEEIADQLRPYVGAGCAATILWPLDGDHVGAPAVLARVGELLDATS
jgi:alkanesulfonate monooxygenase SsuD/methylene tetrahydromethanopterin reductase-like flavin-dependent oxidoreductase (luciferase family)